MTWRRNKGALAHEFRDLEFVPPGRSAWDCTLSCLAYGIRMDISGRPPDLNSWAARHGLAPSKSYAELGDRALVLWHGTSRPRAEKIAEHGLFHKQGLWTARHPRIPHAFCRMRSERFGADGAVVCIVLDRDALVEGRDFDAEGGGNIFRFHHRLPPEVVEYVMVQDEIRFAGGSRAAAPKPWPRARFKRTSGAWAPVQKAPVRFSGSDSFSSLSEYVRLCVVRLLDELDGASPLEVFSVLYSLIGPWDCLRHDDIIEIMDAAASRRRRTGKWHLFMPAQPATSPSSSPNPHDASSGSAHSSFPVPPPGPTAATPNGCRASSISSYQRRRADTESGH